MATLAAGGAPCAPAEEAAEESTGCSHSDSTGTQPVNPAGGKAPSPLKTP